MKTVIRKKVVLGANTLLALADLKLIKIREQDWSDPSTFLPLKETIVAAKHAGLPLGEYIDATYNVPGSNEATIQEMQKLGVFHNKCDRICEIGPGSGRYLEPVQRICKADHYEIYETAAPWAKWLVDNYNVVLRPTDGKSLAATPTGSVDFVHAHKVLVCVPFLGICRYLLEMMRVTKPGGAVVFDAFTDECLDDDSLQTWIDTDINSGCYPSLVLKKLVIDLFDKNGFDLLGTFLIPMKPGTTQYFAFRRR